MDKVKKYLPLGAAIAGVLALILFFACDVVYMEVMGEKVGDAVNGWEATFGKKEEGVELVKFAFMNFLTVILLIGAIACAVLSYLKPENKMFAYIAAGLFALAAIFFFCAKGFYCSANDVESEMKEYLKLGVGAIIAAILSLLSAAAVAVPAVLKK
ncbi:MAG: hypothetical protein IJV83_05595 [Clostridia bacterium]|nr:hypothetical protein [Clostridia bacterium]MBQ9714776.1 hypothetical protein [Clostridia bacterium]